MITAIFDMHNLIHRSYSVAVLREGKPPTPEATYAHVGGTVNRVLRSVGDETSPLRTADHTVRWVGAWDGGGDTFRHREFPGYKAGRKPHPEGFDSLIARCRALFAEDGKVPQFRVLGWEADDVIATLARLALAGRPEDAVVAVSNDRDLLMLARDRGPTGGAIVVMDPSVQKMGTFRPAADGSQGQINPVSSWWTADRVRREYGIAPERLADLKALQGDEGDGIPGTKGFGAKRARLLIGNFGSIEVGWEKGARRTTSKSEADVARLLTPENLAEALRWRAFIRLRDDVPGLDRAFATTAEKAGER